MTEKVATYMTLQNEQDLISKNVNRNTHKKHTHLRSAIANMFSRIKLEVIGVPKWSLIPDVSEVFRYCAYVCIPLPEDINYTSVQRHFVLQAENG